VAENVSRETTVMNMGWVVESAEINRSNVERVPALLADRKAAPASPADPARARLSRLAAQYLPRRVGKPGPARESLARPRAGTYLDAQLDTLRRMYDDLKGDGYRENFGYITARTLHVMAGRRTSDFGDVRLFKASELQAALQLRGR
jgi:hypothetical protein